MIIAYFAEHRRLWPVNKTCVNNLPRWLHDSALTGNNLQLGIAIARLRISLLADIVRLINSHKLLR